MPVFSRPNEKLPLEVLGLIFENLLEKDDEYELDGLEIDQMLLVCRFWARAARAHHSLWSYIYINFSLKLKYEFWLSYAITRIERAGQSQPLHLHITSGEELSSPLFPNQDHHLSQEHVKQLLCVLAGPDGEVAKRWKGLVFAPGPIYGLLHVDKFLSFPTPLLKSLDLSGIAINSGTNLPFLPSTPSLVYLEMKICNVPHLEEVSSLIVLELLYSPPADTAMLKRVSTHLELYIVRGARSWTLTETVHLPKLLVLEIMTPLVIGSIDKLVLPNLYGLQINLRTSNDISLLIGAPGIDLAKLQKLGLAVTDEEIDLDELAMLFEAAPNIDELMCSDMSFAFAALKLLLDIETLYNKSPGLHFRYPSGTTILGVGDEREPSILMLVSKMEQELYASVTPEPA